MDNVKIIFLGDVSFSGRNATDSSFIDDSLKELFKTADAVICNFESTLSHNKEPGLFQSHESCARLLKEAGVTHAIVANNHTYDYGYEVFETTVSILEKAGIEPLGLKRNQGTRQDIVSLKIKGVNIGLFASGWTKVLQEEETAYEYVEYNQEEIGKIILSKSSEYDHLLLICHKGKMFVEYPSPSDKKAYHHYLNLGASAVIGHHPHVIQGLYSHQNKLVAYSLGNFYFDSTEGNVRSWFSREKQDIGLVLAISLNKERLIEFDNIPVKKMGTLVVKMDNPQAEKVIKHLETVSSITHKNMPVTAHYYWQYLRYVIPHFVRVLFHHKFKRP